MGFKNLIQITPVKASTPGLKKRGCDFCPLNKKKGINKVFGKVKGKRIFIWAQSPGPQENKKQKELIGPSGRWLWKELRRVHIKRKHCDIQNVVRCMPADINLNTYPPLKMRAPTKEEAKCCSIYNEQALHHSKARLHLVFGAVAAQSLLGREYRKDKKIFYSDNLKAWIVCLDHPSYFIRMGYTADSERVPNEPLKRFRNNLIHASKLIKNKTFDRFQFLKDQNYIGVTDRKTALKAFRRLKRAARKTRLIADMETGRVDKYGRPDDNGEWVKLCCGFCSKPGTSYTFVLHKVFGVAKDSVIKLNDKLVRKLVRDPNIKYGFHYGASDTDVIKKYLHEDVPGFDYDTLTAEFFRDPNARAYGLAAITTRRYPDFMNYKDIRAPEAFTEDFRKQTEKQKKSLSDKMEVADKKGKFNLARLPWKKMVLYNGADCHVEKLVEQSTLKYVHQPLMGVYVDAGHILYRMQNDPRCLPTFDYDWYKKIRPILKGRVKYYAKKVRKLVGHKYINLTKTVKGKEVKKRVKFNPGSPEQIYWLLYEKLKLKQVEEHDDTRAMTLKLLGAQNKKVNCIWQLREAEKELSMVESYKNCADLNNGHLRTIWKLTGTRTGRLSSGKTKERSDDNVINFQNVPLNWIIRCLFVSSKEWYKVYKYWLKHGPFTKKNWKRFKNVVVELGFDFSQNELRQLAEESGDKNLIAMFASKDKWECKKKNGGCGQMHSPDPHVEVGHALTGWAREKIAHDDRIRKLVKNMQFGLVYGLQGAGLFRFITALGVKTTLQEVEKYHKKYFKRFPGVKMLQAYYRDMAEKKKYVVNMFKFKRKLIQNEAVELGEEAGKFFGNIAINTPIQGASHQLLLMAVASLWRKAIKYYLLQHPTKEVHDALYFGVKLKNLMQAVKQGLDVMLKEPVEIVEHDFKLKKRVPLAAKPKAGFRFGVQVEGVGNGDMEHEYQFLNKWCEENKTFVKDFKKQQHELESLLSV